VPPETPETLPVPEPIVATTVLLLVHVPAPEISLKLAVVPWHKAETPVMVAGTGFMITDPVT
jgi:hypothetical protein